MKTKFDKPRMVSNLQVVSGNLNEWVRESIKTLEPDTDEKRNHIHVVLETMNGSNLMGKDVDLSLTHFNKPSEAIIGAYNWPIANTTSWGVVYSMLLWAEYETLRMF